MGRCSSSAVGPALLPDQENEDCAVEPAPSLGPAHPRGLREERGDVLANSHVLDDGPAGLIETLETLERAGVKRFRLNHAFREDAGWLGDTLTCESRQLGAWVERDGELRLAWRAERVAGP